MVLGVFVKTMTCRRGDRTYTYLSLVEAARIDGRATHRTLLRLCEATALRDSDQLDRIIAALPDHADGTWLNTAELDARAAPGFGAIAAVRAVFERLGLDEHFEQIGGRRRSGRLSDTVFVMVAYRLLAPASKRRTIIEWVDGDVELPAGVEAPSLAQNFNNKRDNLGMRDGRSDCGPSGRAARPIQRGIGARPGRDGAALLRCGPPTGAPTDPWLSDEKSPYGFRVMWQVCRVVGRRMTSSSPHAAILHEVRLRGGRRLNEECGMTSTASDQASGRQRMNVIMPGRHVARQSEDKERCDE